MNVVRETESYHTRIAYNCFMSSTVFGVVIEILSGIQLHCMHPASLPPVRILPFAAKYWDNK